MSRGWQSRSIRAPRGCRQRIRTGLIPLSAQLSGDPLEDGLLPNCVVAQIGHAGHGSLPVPATRIAFRMGIRVRFGWCEDVLRGVASFDSWFGDGALLVGRLSQVLRDRGGCCRCTKSRWAFLETGDGRPQRMTDSGMRSWGRGSDWGVTSGRLSLHRLRTSLGGESKRSNGLR